MAATTQLAPSATPGRPYGDFAGKAPLVVVTGLRFGVASLLPAGFGAATLED